jgi:hypothetical protein
MQLEIDGLHEKALLRLMERNNEKTGTGMTRILIRDAAKDVGLWPVGNEPEPLQVETTEAVAVNE